MQPHSCLYDKCRGPPPRYRHSMFWSVCRGGYRTSISIEMFALFMTYSVPELVHHRSSVPDYNIELCCQGVPYSVFKTLLFNKETWSNGIVALHGLRVSSCLIWLAFWLTHSHCATQKLQSCRWVGSDPAHHHQPGHLNPTSPQFPILSLQPVEL